MALPFRIERFKRTECIFLGFSANRNICCEQNESEGKHQNQINQQEQTTAVFRTEIWEAPYIPHTHGASGCGKNETDRAGKTTSFFFHFYFPLQIELRARKT